MTAPRIPWLVLCLCLALTACGGESKSPDVETPDAADVLAEVAADVVLPPDGAGEVEGDVAEVPEPVTYNGVTARQEGDELLLENEKLRVRYRLAEGRYDVETADGKLLLRNAEARAVLHPGPPDGIVWKSSDLTFDNWIAMGTDDGLGQGVRVTLSLGGGSPAEPSFVLTLRLDGGEGTFVTDLLVMLDGVELPPGPGLKELIPLVADPESGGALFIGEDPWQHAVVDNGSDMYFDFAARVYRVGKGDSVWFAGRGGVSNWNTAITDPASGRSVAAGFLSFDRGIGMVANDYEPDLATEDEGRTGFTRFEGFVRYEPFRAWDDFLGTPAMASELFYVDFLPETPFDGLENYASSYVAYHGKQLWEEIPTGWNSWGGGGGEGGLGTNLNEEIIYANLDAMIEDFAPWGMKYFLIDNGWEVEVGDWETHPDRFPPHDGMEGMPWLAKKVKEAGLIPGIWIAPFWVKSHSKLAQEHPDWLAPEHELGGFLLGEDDDILDLANPEVLEWLHDLFVKLTQEWGFQWIKMDFSYYALFAEELYGNEQSAAEAYHNALDVIRDAIGPDTFFVSISAMGLCFDTADGGRTTLDNMPSWGDGEDQGIKITLRTAAHRYYLNWLWSNHHDLLFYRPTIGLTLNEARAWTSAVALMGGIVKLGDPYTMMHEHPDWLALARPIIPVYPRSARPLDMFELLHPEVWHLPVEREGRTWDVVGLFNWGTNQEILTGKQVAEETRTRKLELASVGLDPAVSTLAVHAWDLSCEWIHDGLLEATLEPRTETVVVLRPQAAEPTIAATSRHLLGGAVEVTGEQVETLPDGRTQLSATIDQPAGHPLNVLMDGAGLTFSEVTSPPGAQVVEGPCEGTWLLQVTPETSPATLEVVYE